MIDTHTHLDYLDDPASARGELGLSALVYIGASPEHARSAVALAEEFSDVYATVGLHPTDTDEDSPEARAAIEALLDHPRVVGVGESGLDDYWDDTKRSAQVSAFEWQLELARRSGKPLVIHTREAAADTLRLMEEEQAHEIGGVMHCFTESIAVAQAAMEMNFYISFSGIVTFKNATAIRDVAAYVPLERMLIETDSPYLAPVPYRGKTNQPGYVKHVAEEIARVKGVSVEEVGEVTTRNFCRLFKQAA